MSTELEIRFLREIRASGFSALDLAKSLPVDVETARRWLDGTATPRPRMIEMVLRFLDKQVRP